MAGLLDGVVLDESRNALGRQRVQGIRMRNCAPTTAASAEAPPPKPGEVVIRFVISREFPGRNERDRHRSSFVTVLAWIFIRLVRFHLDDLHPART